MTAYLIIMILFVAPLGADKFVEAFFAGKEAQSVVRHLAFVSPISVCFNLPLSIDRDGAEQIAGNWWLLASFVGFYGTMSAFMIVTMSGILHMRWRVRS